MIAPAKRTKSQKRRARRARAKANRIAEQGQERGRWEAAQTDRLNKDHWCGVNNQPINFDLEQDLETIVKRCQHEKHNNPMVEGVINTHTIDLIGETGPSLQVMSDSPRYNSLLEEIWQEWWSECTVEGISGVDLMARYNENDWDKGNSLAQILDMSSELPSEAIIKTRLLDIAPYRLSNPWGYSLGDRVLNGVRFDDYGRPTQYYICLLYTSPSPRD